MREIEQATDLFDENEKGKVAQNGRFDVGSREFAAGDGVRVGYSTESTSFGDESKVALHLPEDIAHRESNFDGMPYPEYKSKFSDWAFEVIDDATGWVKYKGMWGRRTNVEGENGPQGPKWDTEGNIRRRWGEPKECLEWMDSLLLNIAQDDAKPAALRRRALQELVSRERLEM